MEASVNHEKGVAMYSVTNLPPSQVAEPPHSMTLMSMPLVHAHTQRIKGIAHPKIFIVTFTHLHAIPNP